MKDTNLNIKKKHSLIKTWFALLITTAIILFLIFLLIRPTVYLSKQSGFPKNEAVKYENGKIRFIVPESADITNHTLIPIKLNWFTANRLGSVINIQPKQGKVLVLDFNNRKYDEVIFELTVKNLFGIKTKYDVIIDYSNYLRIFFPENYVGEIRKPIVLPYYKMDREFRHIKEELYKIESFFRFDENGKPETKPIAKSVVFSKIEAKGRAFLVNNKDHITVYYDFVLPGIFENQSQKTFILNYISRSQKTLKTLNPADINLRLKFKQAPFYVSDFLGWFYYDQTGNRVNVGIGEEINIPAWIKYEFRLIARYKYEIEDQPGGEINKKGYIAISYFDGPERIHFEIIKKGTPVDNFKPNKPGFEIQGWYLDEALTKPYDFTPGNNIANKNLSLYLKSKKNSEPIKTHRITFITPPHATQLVPVFRAHGEKLDLNYSLPSMVTGYENGKFSELDYWTIVDPVSGKDTGKRFDFSTPITSDLTLKAHMRELKFPTPDREVNFRIIDSVDGKVLYEKRLTLKDNKIQEKDKAEINQILAQKPSDKNHLLGKFTFNDWYLNADLNTKFDVNKEVEPGVTELNVFGLYNFKSSGSIPDPTNPTDPKPTDPTLVKVTFLSDTSSILSVQTNPKNETFKGTLPAISKSGYRFKHWAYLKNGQIAGQFGLSDVLTEDTTLYPIFEKDPSTPLPDTTVEVTIVNRLLGTKEVRLVKKGELLNLDPQQYNTKLGPYLYEFSRFSRSNGTTFDHLTERIFTNTTVYVEHTKISKDKVNYQINHIFEGVGTIAERTITETKQALVDSQVTVSPADKLSGYDHGFELETTESRTKQISGEYTTQFTLKYRRRLFDVNFETNFNNQFTGDVSPNSNQKVKYEGTATEPSAPTISSPGYKYTFVQWQLKSSMNGQYVKTQAYDFNTPITGHVDLVAYFEKKKTTATYTIKHIFQGISGQIDERVDEQKISEQVGKSITVTEDDRDKSYDEHFEVADFAETKTVAADGSTTFEIRYARKTYTVTYEVNYNGNHFSDVTVGGQPQTQLVKYEGKITKPSTNPTLTKPGYQLTFVQWQEKTAMNGTYSQIDEFNFANTKVTGNMTLVAYFAENAKPVNYTINHVFEGVDDIAVRTESRVHQALADSNKTISRVDRLTEFDEHFTVEDQTQTKNINRDGSTVFTLNYVRKSYDVFYAAHRGYLVDSPFINAVHVGDEPEPYKAKYQSKVKKPSYTPGLKQPGYSYRFVHWQDESKMNGTYQEITGFDFENDRVNGTMYLLAYFVQTVEKVNYTIKHVFEGVDDIAEKTDARLHQALTDTEVTVSRAQRLTEFDEHFTVEDQSQTQKIKGDGKTVFTLNYVRKSYTVTYEVNFNGNHFSDVTVGNQPQSLQVKYEGKITKPATNPTLTKEGYDYQFVQWQEKTAMNGNYSQIAEFNFANTRVTGNITLVAYFTQNAKSVNYTINHVFEGVDDIAVRTESRVHQALADSSKTISRDNRLTEFDEHFTVADQSQTKNINRDGSTVFTLNYVRKSYDVFYAAHRGYLVDSPFINAVHVGDEPEPYKAKYQAKVKKPAYTPGLKQPGYSYRFVHWQDESKMNGTYQEITGFDFENDRVNGTMYLLAYFVQTVKKVNYTINHVFEGVDDIAEKTDARLHQALTDTEVTVSRAQRLTEFDEHFTVEDQSQTQKIKGDGKTVFTLNYVRKSYIVTYEVNYNGNHFNDVTVGGQPQTQLVKYEGKITKPVTNPTLTKEGYNYTFVQWQEKTAMNGTYSQIAEFNFANTRVTGNTTLVAYFAENAKPVNYTINHVFEGVDDIAQRTDARVHQALADSSKTISRDNRLTEFDEHFTVEDQTQTKNINRDGSTVFTLNYVRKSYTVTYEVNFNGNHFSDVTVGNQPQSLQVKYEGKITKPAVNPTLTKEGYNYQFVHWQEKTAMNGTYSQIDRFNFANQRITRNTTLVAYFTENPRLVNYTVNHVFEGVQDIAERTDARVHQALADSNKTISYADRLTEFDEHFRVVNTYQQTEKINRLGTTVFTIRYRRKLYDVYYEVQYNDTQFGPDLQIDKPVGRHLQVPYQGKAPQPHDPVVSKPGYTYTFIHWQLKEEMNGTYKKVSAYNFNQGVEKNITLVAYFEEKLNKVNYQVTYFLEKQGESSSLNNTYQEVTKTYTAPAFSQVHLQPYQDLDLTKYDANTVDVRNKLHAKLTHENNTVVLKKYYQLMQYQISFTANNSAFGNIPVAPDYQKVTRKVNSSLYHFSANTGYKFIGISLDGSENNLVETFIMPANDVVVTAIFKENKKAIIYNIRLENADGTFTTQTKTYYAKVGSVHNTTFENPDTNIYEKWEADKNSLVVSESQVQNLILIKVTRKKFKVTFNVLNSSVAIQERTRRYGERIGDINNSGFKQNDVLTFTLNNAGKTKQEVEGHEVKENSLVTIKVLNERKANHYPQTEVTLSQSSIFAQREYTSDLYFDYGSKHNLSFSYKRHVVFDKNGEQYELFRGKYFKYEPIEFIKIPGNTGYFTKKIIDAAPYNLHKSDYDASYESSIVHGLVKNIEYISYLQNLSVPTEYFDKPVSLTPAINNPALRPLLRKQMTDYARTVFRQYSGTSKFYRGADLTKFKPNGLANTDLSYLPIYQSNDELSYWLRPTVRKDPSPIHLPEYLSANFEVMVSQINIVRGVVLAKDNN